MIFRTILKETRSKVNPLFADIFLMGMLDRYKKKGGFIQLLNLLETSNKAKQDQFLNLIQQENSHWELALKKRILNIDKVTSWEKSTLSEIISRIQPLTLAVALRHYSEEKKTEILNVLSQSEQRKIQNLVSETNPTPAEIATCIAKIISEVRSLIQQGIIKLEKIDPEIAIPDNIEDQLNQKSQSHFLENPNPEEVTSNSQASSTSEGEPETSLDFSGANRHKKTKDDKQEEKLDFSKTDSSKDELDFLKRKVNSVIQENTHLKQELALLRNKLEQIKKIA